MTVVMMTNYFMFKSIANKFKGMNKQWLLLLLIWVAIYYYYYYYYYNLKHGARRIMASCIKKEPHSQRVSSAWTRHYAFLIDKI